MILRDRHGRMRVTTQGLKGRNPNPIRTSFRVVMEALWGATWDLVWLFGVLCT